MALCPQPAVTGQSVATLTLSVCRPLMETAQVHKPEYLPSMCGPAKPLLTENGALTPRCLRLLLILNHTQTLTLLAPSHT